jgi:hypothetical protein
MRGDPGPVHPPGGVLDEEQHLRAAQEYGIDAQQVHRQDRLGLRLQAGPPAISGSLGALRGGLSVQFWARRSVAGRPAGTILSAAATALALADIAVELPRPDEGYPFTVGVLRYVAAEACPAVAGKDRLRGVVPAFTEQAPRTSQALDVPGPHDIAELRFAHGQHPAGFSRHRWPEYRDVNLDVFPPNWIVDDPGTNLARQTSEDVRGNRECVRAA